MIEQDLTGVGLTRVGTDAAVFEQASGGSSVNLSLIVEELQVIRTLVPFVDLAISTRTKLISGVTLLSVTKSGRSSPVRIFWWELLGLESLDSFQLCLV